MIVDTGADPVGGGGSAHPLHPPPGSAPVTLQLSPLCILSVNSILARCVALLNIPIHNEDFHTFHTIGEIKTGNARSHALIQFDLPSFDQKILSSRIFYSKP